MKHLLAFFLFSVSIAVAHSQTIERWDGNTMVDFFNDTSGKKLVVVNCWATFCKPCVDEIPGFLQISKKYEHEVQLILLSLDSKEWYSGKLKRFARKQHWNNADIAWLDETDANYFCPLLDKQWEGSIPATVIWNRKSNKRYFFEGAMGTLELEKQLMQMR